MPFSPPLARSSALHTRARLLGTRMKTDGVKCSKGKDPKPINH